jgi:hypothetical protein
MGAVAAFDMASKYDNVTKIISLLPSIKITFKE